MGQKAFKNLKNGGGVFMGHYLSRNLVKFGFFGFVALLTLSLIIPERGYGADEKVTIGYHPAMCLAAIYVAKDKKLFEKNGIEAKIIEYQGGPPMIQAFHKKEIDMGFLLTWRAPPSS